MEFFVCKTCGNVITKLNDASVPVMCCGKKMEALVPGSVEASTEKHTPLCAVEGNKVFVMVGEVEHPMVEAHYIQWIAIETEKGTQIKYLTPGEAPAASFLMGNGEKLVAVYAYCNLHGLWKTEYEEPVVCDLQPLDTETKENYLVCRCNNVRYFDILNAAGDHKNMESLLSVFDAVKNTTRCSSGCGGCYNKVLTILSEMMNGNLN